MPAQPAMICGIIDKEHKENDFPSSGIIPNRTSKAAITIRWSRRHNPGQPSGNVEKSRRNNPPLVTVAYKCRVVICGESRGLSLGEGPG